MSIRQIILSFSFTIFTVSVSCQKIEDLPQGPIQDSILWDSISHWFGEDYNVTLEYLNLGIEQYFESGNINKYIDCKLGKFNIYFQRDQFMQCDEILEETKTEVINLIGKDSETYRNVLNVEVSLLEVLGDHSSAIAGYENIIKQVPAKNDSELAYYLQSLGRTKRKKGDFQDALNYLEKANRLSSYKKNLTKDKEVNYRSIANQIGIAEIHISLNQLDTAIVILKKVKQALNKSSNNKKGQAQRYLSSANLILARAYFEKEAYMKASKHLNSIIQLAKSQNTAVSSGIYSLIGDIYFAQKKFKQSITYYESAIDKNLIRLEGFTRLPDLAINYNNLAKTYFAMDSIDRSLHYLQKAFFHATNKFQATSLYELPDVNDFNLNRKLLKLLQLKAIAHKAKYQSSNGTIKDLKTALNSCYLEHEMLRKLYQQFQAEGSRFDLYENAQTTYELGIEVAQTLYKKSKEKKYLFNAWQLAEYSKAIILRESLNENLMVGMGQVPESLLKKERNLNLQKTLSTKVISKLNRTASSKQATINEHKEKGFEIERQLQQVKKRIQQNYPQYYNYKYDISVVEIEKLIQYLNDRNACLVEYFVGKTKYYIFHINDQGIQIHDFKRSDFPIKSIEKIRNLLSHPPTTDSFDTQSIQFHNHAHLLYQRLLAPVLKTQPPKDGLIIIPDGPINYIPFELLVSKQPKKSYTGYATKAIQYLLEDYPISYASSATHLVKSNKLKKEKATHYFIGFAPSFSGTKSRIRSDCLTGKNLSKLHCNIKEVEDINDIAKGSNFLDTEASKSTFLEKTPNHQIIHLATHACVDPVNPKFNKIYFSDDELTHFDLQHLKLNAEMVVLSACNTGIGKLQIGEGLMSLSRSFQIAGCKSSLMSLWPVDDCTTSDLMLHFYTNLQKGLRKDIALRDAKLAYLKEADISGSHPYFWGAFTLFGNNDPIISLQPSSFSYWKIGLVVFPILFFLFLIKRKSGKQRLFQ